MPLPLCKLKSSSIQISKPMFHVNIPMLVVSITNRGKLGVCTKENYEFIKKFHEKYDEISLTWNDHEEEYALEESEIKVGMIVVTFYKAFWCRGVVEALIQDEGISKAQVYMVDFASSGIIDFQNLRRISFEDRNHPWRSYEFSLFGVTDISNTAQKTDVEFKKLNKLFLGQVFLTQFVFSKEVNNTRTEYAGFMKTVNGDFTKEFCKDVGDLIVRKRWSSYNSPRNVLVQLRSYKWNLDGPEQLKAQELGLHTSVKVVIAHVNSLNDFYIRKSSDSELYANIQTMLKSAIMQCYDGFELWKTETNSKLNICMGMVYDGEEWHRVQLKTLFPQEKMVELFLMDRGNFILKPIREIYQVPKEVLKYPSLVYHCTLHLNLTPQGESLWKMLSTKLTTLHDKSAPGSGLSLRCYKIATTQHSVRLDTGYGQDYGSALAKLGYATYAEEKTMVPGKYCFFRGSSDVFLLGNSCW